MGIVDMIMVGKLGVHSIAAVGFGEIIVFTLIVAIGISLMTATQTMTARRYGQNLFSRCSECLLNGQILGLLLGTPFMILGYFYCGKFITLFINDPLTIRECTDYASIQFLGILFPISCFIYRGFYTGIQKTSIYLKVVLISNLINIYLNIGLIFGREAISDYFFSFQFLFIHKLGLLWTFFPFPELGVSGAAIGTVIASAVSFLCFFFYYFTNGIYSKYKITKLYLDYSFIGKQLKLTWPIIKREGSFFIGITLLIAIMGLIGNIELAASNIIMRIYGIAIMPAVGIGSACASIVSYFLGQKQADQSWFTIKDSLRYTLFIMGGFAFLFAIFPKQIISVFSSDPTLLQVAIPLLRFLAVFAIIDGIVLVLTCTLEGAGDMNFIARISLIFIWIIFIPLAYLTGIYLNLGMWGPWISWMLGFLYLMFMLINRTIKGYWRTISI